MVETDPFRIRGHVADFDAIVDDLRVRSAATRSALPMKADIAYGDEPSERLDVFIPEDANGGAPVHMFFHGGYWRMFSKNDYSYIAEGVVAAGAIAVIVDYALMPAVRLATIVDQVRRARRWVADHIGEQGGDASRLSVSGHSAGAQLATCLFSDDAVPSGIKSALLLGGVYDLEPLQDCFLKSEIGLTDAEVDAFSPCKRTHDPATSVSILVGARETEPFHAQADDFARYLTEQGSKVSQTVIVARNHMDAVRDLGDPNSITGRCLTRMIASAA